MAGFPPPHLAGLPTGYPDSAENIPGIALALLFITETFAAFSGLGYFIMNRMEVRNYEEMYAAILTLAAIGIIAYMALDMAERKLCPWKK